MKPPGFPMAFLWLSNEKSGHILSWFRKGQHSIGLRGSFQKLPRSDAQSEWPLELLRVSAGHVYGGWDFLEEEPWKTHGKTRGKWWFNGDLMGFYGILPRSSWFHNKTWIPHGFSQGLNHEMFTGNFCRCIKMVAFETLAGRCLINQLKWSYITLWYLNITIQNGRWNSVFTH